MERQGCEIEAVGINYTIGVPKAPFSSLLRTWRGSEGEGDGKVEAMCGFRRVLKDVNCRARPWELLAIVGPSGAGKSSLLGVLAGKIVPQGGAVFVNQKPVDEARFRKITGHVAQKDTLFPLLTVEETLMFTAKLRLRLPRMQLVERVKSLILELGLEHVGATRVGDDRVRGVSGGERRRVSIGVEVIHDPKVLILDEPTSGLDSSSALQIVDMLKTMAETRGRTIVVSIHQPGFRIVKSFNSILLLADGSVLHHGTTEQLAARLASMDLPVPNQVNVVEFAIDSIDAFKGHEEKTQQMQQFQVEILLPRKLEDLGGEGRIRGGKRTLQQLFLQSKVVDEETIDEIGIDPDLDLHCGFANSRMRETAVLTHRFSKNIFRTKELFACRTIQMLAAGLVLGSIFCNLKDDLLGARERVGLFAFVLTFLLSSTVEALPIFLQERDILLKETSSGSYRVSSYAIANALVYLPFLLILAVLFSVPLYWLVGLNGQFPAFLHFILLIWLILYTANSVVVCFSALVPDFIVGNSVISGVMGSFFLFSGYFISRKEIPRFWVFMNNVSLFKYPFEGFLINEFSGSRKCLQYAFGACLVTGDDLLHEEGYWEESRWRNVAIMGGYILAYRFMSYVILRIKCSSSSTSYKRSVKFGLTA